MYLSFERVVDIENDELRVSVLFACSSVRYSGNDELRVCLVFLLFRSAHDKFFCSVMSRSRWRPSGWKRHSRHHQVAEPATLDLELFAYIIMALIAGVSCVRKTYIGCISVFLSYSSQPRGYYDAFAIARAGCSAGGEWLLPPEGTVRAEFFCAFHLFVELLGGCCCVSIIAGPGVTCKLARHMTAASILRYFRSMPQAGLLRWAGQPRCVPFLVEGHCGELAGHKLRSCFFRPFLLLSPDTRWLFSTSRWSICAQSRHRVLIFPVPCRVVSIWAHWRSMFDVISPQVFF